MSPLVKPVTHFPSLLFPASTCRIKFASIPQLGITSLWTSAMDKPLSFSQALPAVEVAFRVNLESDEFSYFAMESPWPE